MGGTKTRTGLMALAATLAVAQPATAHAAPAPSNDVSVAIVDVGANALRSKDPNVVFVDLTPPLKPGQNHGTGHIGKMDHGDIVAQSFVQEYRRLDPTAKITIYTVNPFVQEGIAGPMKFSIGMLKQALPKMREANVRIAVTTFGVADQAAGDRILSEFRANDMIVFAATPNEREDRGIWPAASPQAIAVADGVTADSGFNKTPKWGSWVDFVANGIYHNGDIDTDGSSFATPRAAAYGAYVQKSDPGVTLEGLKTALKAGAGELKIRGVPFPRLDGDEVARRFLTLSRTVAATAAKGPAPSAPQQPAIQLASASR